MLKYSTYFKSLVYKDPALYSRIREEQLAKAHREEIDSLLANHAHESEELLAGFTQAQEMLKDKIAELKLL